MKRCQKRDEHYEAGRGLSGQLRPSLGCRNPEDAASVDFAERLANRHSPITIVAAISSKFEEPLYPTEVLISVPEGGLSVDPVVPLNQLRSIDTRRLVRRLGAIQPNTMTKVEQSLQISLGLLKI